VVTRAQLDKLLATPDFSGVVAWVSPEWVKDKDKTTYLWTAGVMDDANVILSSAKAKVDYKDPASLKGKQFGGIAGHKYAGIDDLVAAGAVKREDAEKERNNLRKLEAGRIDATCCPVPPPTTCSRRWSWCPSSISLPRPRAATPARSWFPSAARNCRSS
jgi:polar amino acid transport system substrate-binding protein